MTIATKENGTLANLKKELQALETQKARMDAEIITKTGKTLLDNPQVVHRLKIAEGKKLKKTGRVKEAPKMAEQTGVAAILAKVQMPITVLKSTQNSANDFESDWGEGDAVKPTAENTSEMATPKDESDPAIAEEIADTEARIRYLERYVEEGTKLLASSPALANADTVVPEEPTVIANSAFIPPPPPVPPLTMGVPPAPPPPPPPGLLQGIKSPDATKKLKAHPAQKTKSVVKPEPAEDKFNLAAVMGQRRGKLREDDDRDDEDEIDFEDPTPASQKRKSIVVNPASHKKRKTVVLDSLPTATQRQSVRASKRVDDSVETGATLQTPATKQTTVPVEEAPVHDRKSVRASKSVASHELSQRLSTHAEELTGLHDARKKQHDSTHPDHRKSISFRENTDSTTTASHLTTEQKAALQDLSKHLSKQYIPHRQSAMNKLRHMFGGTDRNMKVQVANSIIQEIKRELEQEHPGKINEYLKSALNTDFNLNGKTIYGAKQGELSTQILTALDKLEPGFSSSDNNPWNAPQEDTSKHHL